MSTAALRNNADKKKLDAAIAEMSALVTDLTKLAKDTPLPGKWVTPTDRLAQIQTRVTVAQRVDASAGARMMLLAHAEDDITFLLGELNDCAKAYRDIDARMAYKYRTQREADFDLKVARREIATLQKQVGRQRKALRDGHAARKLLNDQMRRLASLVPEAAAASASEFVPSHPGHLGLSAGGNGSGVSERIAAAKQHGA